MQVEEGGVTVEVESARDGASEGSGSEVFYNPEMELNRDVTVAVLRAYPDREPRAETYLDAMAASGVRGTRAAAEGFDVTCADVDPDAVELAARNLAPYDGEAVERDANALLHESFFDVVDVDPYGSPMPFADAAVAGTRNLLCVTATDTAPLCGAHFDSGVRRYSAVPRNTEYHPEMGLRVLLSALVRRAAARDKAATPVLSHVSRHYVRTYLELDASASRANRAVEELGHVYHCQDCLERSHEYGLVADPPGACPACGSDRVVTAGPLWLGPVADPEFAAAVRERVTDDMGEAKRARDTLETVETELDTPTHYDQHRLTKLWGRPAAGMDEFVAALRDAGFDASRAHYSGTAFKTDASVADCRDATADLG
ncbi:tRNA (guanine(26)-N(2))-dimethyltransferase [Candidatus Halobonum tyrrellensis]|uniref:tRNA (guanine(26)-N(2))-dimethyltransferase n=1 Tax=Candidatus Halobonum tyrrellensis G22 TaxID=1324957 RepID=V4HD39_9EURY|nr:tRNA (guanine(26)-N(2))-dimethyltransferase [Candidatus Halobonum tyrrellensis]ESP88635.1 N(2),N(2)-dimethylguanosine tRNA methyltransferase [Candidatus Halobonum tyrrellensis G22]